MGLPQAPDLVVLQVEAPVPEIHPLFEYAREVWPQTFFLLSTSCTREDVQPLFSRYGDMPLASPHPGPLCAAVAHEVTTLSHGSLRGLSLPSFLQMMEWEARSLAIRVQSEHDWGRLHLKQGRLVDAYVHRQQQYGEAAVFEILNWQDTAVTIERSYRNEHDVIGQPLTSLLMEAMKRRDEGQHSGALRLDDFILDKGHAQGAVPTTPFPAPPLLSTDDFSSVAVQKHNVENVRDTLDSALGTIDGAVAATLLHYGSGTALGSLGSGGADLEMAIPGNTEVMRALMRTIEMLGIPGGIEDILIGLEEQYRILSVVPDKKLFMYLVLSEGQSNLAMARYKLCT
ncbi:DUF4388 domain-containing protein [Deinococcus hopiensis]|uniref:PatA-like N-terminal domain-containing protein n=1 Tax=Deinococcus hopiensis KR-140 TaxID=695939 RepID=A0A1W1VUZ4_9DEIO|nr:DUF4388 domain-containing protein [Deinococcus hopiensis]SMB97146.1 protein of unknown function [Deinococcus hopiensis KR-140]